MPRQDERTTYLKEVELEFASGKRLARISDVSMGGCYVDSIASVPVGESVTVGFNLPDGGSLPFEGKVAYVLDGFGFGVQFKDLTEDHHAYLKSLINSNGG